MGQISAKFVIKVVGCLPPPPLSPPPARTHLPPPRPHSPLYSAITAALSAAKLTNESLKTVHIQFCRKIAFSLHSLQSCAGSASAGAGHRDFGSSAKVSLLRVSFDVSSVLVQVVLSSVYPVQPARFVRRSCAWNVHRRIGRVRACASNCPTDQLLRKHAATHHSVFHYQQPPDIRHSDGFQNTQRAPAIFT